MSDTSLWDFAGKYAISSPDGTQLLTVAGNSLQLSPGNPDQPSATQAFNTYGELATGFTLQAPNAAWQYVGFSNDYYSAGLSRGDAAGSVFRIQPVAGEEWCHIIEAVGAAQYYIVAGAKSLTRLAKDQSAPPTAARFILQNKPPVTYGLKDIVKMRSTLSNPLTGVYLAGKDLRHITFVGSDVSGADFSAATLDNTSNFNGCTADGAIFNQAKLQNWVANGLTFKNCSFNGANFTGASLTSSVLNGCVLNQAVFASAILQITDFTNAVMVGCQFTGAVVTDTIFKGATLTNSDFSTAKAALLGVDFSDALLIGVNLAWIENPGGPNPIVTGPAPLPPTPIS